MDFGLIVSILLTAYCGELGASSVHFDSFGVMYAKVEMNKVSSYFIIDTGSKYDRYDSKNGEFGLKYNESSVCHARLKICGSNINTTFYDIEMSHFGKVKINNKWHVVSGIICANTIKKLVTAIDMGKRMIVLKQSLRGPCSLRVKYTKAPYVSNDEGLLLVDVQVNGNSYCMAIDTGASYSAVHSEYESIFKTVSHTDMKLRGAGSQNDKPIALGKIELFKIGNIEIKYNNIIVSDISKYDVIGKVYGGAKCIGLIGCDILIDNDVIINLVDCYLEVKDCHGK